MKKVIIAVVTITFVFAVGYFGSAYYAPTRLKNAALSGNAADLEAVVDFPAVRASLKPQLSAIFNRQWDSDPKLRGNPFGGLAKSLMPKLVDRAIDSIVTAKGLAAIIQAQPTKKLDKNTEPGNLTNQNPASIDYQWIDINNVNMNIIGDINKNEVATLKFRRIGLFGWELIGIIIPFDALMESK